MRAYDTIDTDHMPYVHWEMCQNGDNLLNDTHKRTRAHKVNCLVIFLTTHNTEDMQKDATHHKDEHFIRSQWQS